MLSEIHQAKKNTVCYCFYMESKTSKSWKQRVYWWLLGARERRERFLAKGTNSDVRERSSINNMVTTLKHIASYTWKSLWDFKCSLHNHNKIIIMWEKNVLINLIVVNILRHVHVSNHHIYLNRVMYQLYLSKAGKI